MNHNENNEPIYKDIEQKDSEPLVFNGLSKEIIDKILDELKKRAEKCGIK